MTTKLFSELGLSSETLKAIDRLGFEQAAPIQAESIPLLMQGRDVIGQSQTGSGKTAAFVVPIVEKIDPQVRAPQAVILCPTRELAIQVSEEVHKLSFFKKGIHALPIYGGQSYDRQFLGLKQGAQIIIGTPGRVMDHMRRGSLRLETVKTVVLDEADTMLDMGFREDIEFILKAMPAERQTVFFSATMPRSIQELIHKYSRDPQSVHIEQKALTVPTVEQEYYEVDRRYKMELLTRLIDLYDFKLGIIFCGTKRMVDDLADHLNALGYLADRLHGDMTQFMRDRVMNKFRKSGLEFLVATDVAARGIDVDDVEVVINYDLPYDVEDYVHRIGRTGRAGRSGRAISFVAGREVFQVHNIERYTHTRIRRCRIPTPSEVDEARTNAFLDKLRLTLQSGEFKKQDRLIERLLEEGFSSTDIASALLYHLQGGETPGGQDRQSNERASSEQRGSRETRPSRDSEMNRVPRRYEEQQTRHAAAPKREERAIPRPAHPVAPAPVAPVKASATSVNPPAPKVKRAEPAAPVQPKLATPATAPSPTKPAVPVAPASPAKAVVPVVAAPPAVHHEPKAKRVEPAAPVQSKAALPAMTPSPAKPAASVVPAAPAKTAVPMAAAPASKLKATPPKTPLSPQPGLKPGGQPVHTPKTTPQSADLAPASKPKRRPAEDQTRLYINAGTEMGITPPDVVATILGVTGLPPSTIGAVDIRERHLFVNVSSSEAAGIISKLNRTHMKNCKIKVKIA